MSHAVLCIGAKIDLSIDLFSLYPNIKLLTNNGVHEGGARWLYVSQEIYEKYKKDDIKNLLRIANINYYVDGKMYWIDRSSDKTAKLIIEEPEPPEPTKEGYEFAGWYKEPECINQWIYGVDVFPNRKDENGNLNMVNLYAGWEKI